MSWQHNSIKFSGTAHRVGFGNNLYRLNTYSNITFECWFRVHTSGNGILADNSRNASYGEQWNIQYNTSTGQFRLRAHVGSDGTGTMYQQSTTQTISTGVWYHYAGVFKNGDNNNWKQYFNGGDISGTTAYSGASTTSTVWTGDTSNLQLGLLASGGGYSEESEVNMCEIRIWSTARTQQQVQSYMYKRLSGSESNLIGYFPCETGSGSTLYDRTSNGNNGTITGATWETISPPLSGSGAILIN